MYVFSVKPSTANIPLEGLGNIDISLFSTGFKSTPQGLFNSEIIPGYSHSYLNALPGAPSRPICCQIIPVSYTHMTLPTTTSV